MKYLIIVESPSKCKKIQKILQTKYPEHIFEVKASVGHIKNLPKRALGVDLKKFDGKFEELSDKKKIINWFKKNYKKFDKVLVATDMDNEGEAIAFDLMNIMGLDITEQNRMIFNEITTTGIINAFENLTYLNINRVNAQRARRIIDRLMGFKISSITKKHFNNPDASAGRVLSITTSVINDRTLDYIENNSKNYHLSGVVQEKGQDYTIKYPETFEDITEIKELLESIKNKDFSVKDIVITNKRQGPPPPFNTSSILSSSPFPAYKTTRTLQTLYQKGHITYIRTDSTNLSNHARSFLSSYLNKNNPGLLNEAKQYSRRPPSIHECIRPTNINKSYKSFSNSNESRLYKIIFDRTVEYMMKDYEYKEYKLLINTNDNYLENNLEININECVFEGFKRNCDKTKYSREELMKMDLTDMSLFSDVSFDNISLFNEASLIRKLEKLHIGRPSTYSYILTNMKEKGYVKDGNIKNEETIEDYILYKNKNVKVLTKKYKRPDQKHKLIVTDLGKNMSLFLKENFTNIMDYNYSMNLELKLNEVEEGKLEHKTLIKDYYNDFKDIVTELKKKYKGVKSVTTYNLGDHGDFKSVELNKTRWGWKIVLETDYFNKKIYVDLPKEMITNIADVKINDIKQLFPQIFLYYGKPAIVLPGIKSGNYIKYNNKNIPLPKKIKFLNLNKYTLELIEDLLK